MDKPKKSLKEISLINVGLCLIVIFIHVSSEPIALLSKDSIAYNFIYIPWRLSAFVVQGFIFLSSLKLYLNYNNSRSYSGFYKGRLIKIIIPYIIWNLIYYFYFISRGYFEFSVYDIIRYLLIGDLVSPFYFIIVITQFYILLPIFDKIIKRFKFKYILAISFIIMLIMGQLFPKILIWINPRLRFIYNDRLFTSYLFYWVMGSFAGLNYDRFKDLLKAKAIYITLYFLILGSLDIAFSLLSLNGNRFWFLETIHVLYSIMAILFFNMLVNISPRLSNRLYKLVRYIDLGSYYIYLSHCLLIFIIDYYFLEKGFKRVLVSYIIRLIFVYTVDLVFCVLYVKIKELIKNFRLSKA